MFAKQSSSDVRSSLSTFFHFGHNPYLLECQNANSLWCLWGGWCSLSNDVEVICNHLWTLEQQNQPFDANSHYCCSCHQYGHIRQYQWPSIEASLAMESPHSFTPPQYISTLSHCQVPRQNCQSVPRQSCQQVPIQEPRQVCQSVPQQQCRTVPRQQCQQVPQQDCRSIPRQVEHEVCNNIPRQQCQQVPRQVQRQQCSNVPRHQCTNVPRQQCTSVPRQQCTNQPRQQCNNVPRQQEQQECRSIPRQQCTNNPRQQCTTVPRYVFHSWSCLAFHDCRLLQWGLWWANLPTCLLV